MSKTIPIGDCMGYAFRESIKAICDDKMITVYTGTIEEPFALEPKRYFHVWINRDGILQDWQCMEGGCGGKFNGKGYPEDIFIELYKPQNIKSLHPSEYIKNFGRNT